MGDFHVGSKMSSCVPFLLRSDRQTQEGDAKKFKRAGVMVGMLDGAVAAVVPVDEQVCT